MLNKERKKRLVNSKIEDNDLIDGALKGKKECYEKLMKKYYNLISHLIRKMVFEKDEVDDLTQETFIKAFNSLHKFDKEFAFSTWLYKIATNNCIDYIRKKKLSTFSIDKDIKLDDDEVRYEIADDNYVPDKRIIKNQKNNVIEKAIEKLPKKYRDIIILRHKYEMNYYEISKELKIPIGTVKAHLFRAREMLNKYLRNKIKDY